MFAIAFLFVRVLCDGFKSQRRLEAEILVLRHQLNVLQQRAPRRLYLTWADRVLFVRLYRGFPRILDAITIIRPETIVRWHRKGFSAFWRIEPIGDYLRPSAQSSWRASSPLRPDFRFSVHTALNFSALRTRLVARASCCLRV
jgi:hypothetical protein